MGSERDLRVELPSLGLVQAPPMIVKSKKDFELDEVDAEVPKKIRAHERRQHGALCKRR